MAAGNDDLKAVFLAFCDSTKKGSTGCTDKTIKKILTDAKLFGKTLNATEMDITFRKVLGNKSKELDFNGFLAVLKAYAPSYQKDHNLANADEAFEKMCAEIGSHGPAAHGTTKVSGDDATKRMTDVGGYTGSHKERFDAETGKGKGIEGRSDRADNTGYVGGYKEKGTYDTKH
jgi:hypothetical protein